MHIYPDYYKDFKCIAQKCRHNCCIGWEIDIDNDTLDFYNTVSGEMQNRLKNNIAYDDTPHFILDKNERCPFLNSKNLCDIICTLGEEHICDICKEHPRFHNELPDRIESGLGLCCEEACRLVLSKKEPVSFISDSECYTDDEIIILRDKVIALLQNRSKKIDERIDDMLNLCDAQLRCTDISKWCDILLELECMDENWSTLLKELKANYTSADVHKFDEYMKERVCEYEQFCVYLIYRHFANSPDLIETQKRACFVAFAYKLLHTLGAVIYAQKGEFGFESQFDLARLFSCEIEYSDENLHTLFDVL